MGPQEEEAVTVAVPESADLTASTKPAEAPKPTRKEVGEWRARNFTVRHATVVACDHKLDLRHIPNTHCYDCWYAFLESNPEGVASVHELLQQGGTKAVTAMHSKKFTKMFGRYIQQKLFALREPLADAAKAEPSIEIIDIAKEAQDAQNIQIEG